MPTSSGTSKRDEVGELSKALRALTMRERNSIFCKGIFRHSIVSKA